MTALEPDLRSRAQQLADAGLIEELIDGLTETEAVELLYDWSFWRRPNQVPPEGWRQWFIRAGRGFGKTRTGAETVRELCQTIQTHGRAALVAPTAGDGRDVLVEGESGILECHSRAERPHYEPSKRRLTWPSGSIATLYSGEEPDRLRGPQHDLVWIDEPASMPLGSDVLHNARLGLRLGKPKLIVTGTPKPRPWLRELEAEAFTHTTTGSTYDNILNLAPEFIELVLGRYEGTRLGLEQLHGAWLDDVEGALWTMEIIEAHRTGEFDEDEPWRWLRSYLAALQQPVPHGNMRRRWRRIVAVDPPGETAECGIVVGTAPLRAVAGRDHAVILADESMAGRPEKWGAAVVRAFREHRCEAVYVEKNQGGDMVRSTIHAVDPTVPVNKITARESKQARAEPVAALYERGWIHHYGVFSQLEDQLTSWVPDESKSPDRLDALVHCCRELLVVTRVVAAKARSATGRNIPT